MGFLFAWKLETRVHCAGVDFHVVQEIILGLWSWTQIILILLMHDFVDALSHVATSNSITC